MSVTYDDIEQAIAELLENKKSLTLANLRQALGDRGSMSTLSKYLQQWKSQRYLDASKNAPPPQSAPAPDPIFSAVQSVWQQMQGIGQQQIAEKEEVFAAQQSHWQEKEAILKSVIEKQGQDYQDAVRDNTALSLKVSEYEQQLLQLQQAHQIALLNLQSAQDTLVREKALYESTYQDLLAHNAAQASAYQVQLEAHQQSLDSQRAIYESTMKHNHSQFEQRYQALESLYQTNQVALALAHQEAQKAPQLHQVLQTIHDISKDRAQDLEAIKTLQDLLQVQLSLPSHLSPPYPSVTWFFSRPQRKTEFPS